MMYQTRPRRLLSFAVLTVSAFFGYSVPAAAQEVPQSAAKQNAPVTPLPTVTSPLSEAMALARKGDCDAAIKKYQQILQEKPKSPDAYAGLARCQLKNGDVDEAEKTANKGVQIADSPPVRVALGEVYFRQGKIPEAEKEWVGVINSGRLAARAYFDLARVRRAIEMNRSAKVMVDKAH